MKNQQAHKCRPIWLRLKPGNAIFGALVVNQKINHFVTAPMREPALNRMPLLLKHRAHYLFVVVKKLMINPFVMDHICYFSTFAKLTFCIKRAALWPIIAKAALFYVNFIAFNLLVLFPQN